MKLRRQSTQQPPVSQQPYWSGVVAYQISDVSEGQAKLVATMVADQHGETYLHADSLADRHSLLLAGRVEGIVAAWCVYTKQTFPGKGSELVRQLSTYSLAITDTVEVENCSLEESKGMTFDELRAMSESQLALNRGGLERWLEGPDIS
jgi:hypothetical protein